MSSKLTVWYNTKCPVCNAGIEWERSRLVQAARAGIIEFRDINLEPAALSRFGAEVEDVRRRLHAVDAEGKLRVGADCAMAVWSLTPGHVWLARLLGLPVIRQIAGFGYDRLPICFMLGTAGKDIGRHCVREGRLQRESAVLHKIVGLNIVLCVGLLTSALLGRTEETAPVHPAPWPIWHWRNHQPTQRELDELHKHDLSPEQAREVDRL